MKFLRKKWVKRGLVSLLCVCIVLCGGYWVYWNFIYPPDDDGFDFHKVEVEMLSDLPEYEEPAPEGYNPATEQREAFEPVQTAKTAVSEYITVSVEKDNRSISNAVVLKSESRSTQGWKLIDGGEAGYFRRLRVSVGNVLCASDASADIGKLCVQVDIEKDGEWICGAVREMEAWESCTITLSQGSAYRLFLWEPERDEWMIELGYTVERW